MATIDISRFASSDQVAVRVAYDRLPGLLRKRLEVPEGAVAVVRRADKTTKLLQPGTSEAEFQDGVLVKRAPIGLELTFPRLVTEDGMDVTVALRVDVVPRASEVDLGQFEKELLGAKDVLTKKDVEAYFGPFVCEAVRFFCSKRRAEPLV